MQQQPTRSQLLSRATSSLRDHLRAAAEVADGRGERVWIVGGLVRDLLLARSSLDIDLVVLGRGERYAQDLARVVGGQPRHHRRFLTSEFTSDAGFDIDIVRARSELYEMPATLPAVRSGTLLEDLFRRDFTVNAMALPLNGQKEDLVDPFNGRSDLALCLLRVLHDRSFLDDPTRLLRGLRLGRKLGFSLEPETVGLAKKAVAEGVFEQLSGPRLTGELQRLLESPGAVLHLLPTMADLGFGRILHPRASLEPPVPARLAALRGLPSAESDSASRWLAVLCLLTWNLDCKERLQLVQRLSLDTTGRGVIEATVPLVQAVCGKLERLDSPHERFRLAESLGPLGRDLARCTAGREVAFFLAAEWPALGRLRPRISGEDLLRLGFAPGPTIGRALEATFEARLDRRISRSEELLFAARWILRRAEAAPQHRDPPSVPVDSGDGD